MKYSQIPSQLMQQIKQSGYELNKELADSPIILRWFCTKGNSKIQKIGSGIFKVNSKHNRLMHTSNAFLKSILEKLQEKHESPYPHFCCTLNEEYGNFGEKGANTLYCVLPIDKFSCIQSHYAKDLINLTYSSLPQNIMSSGKSYIARAIVLAEDISPAYSFKKENTNSVSANFHQLLKTRPYMVEAVLNEIVNSYTPLSERVHHDGEVLVYSDEYLLIDCSLIIMP